MNNIKRQAIRFLVRANARMRYPKRIRGQTLVEYALIIAVISIVAIGVLINLGQGIRGIYTMINSQVSMAAASH